MHAAAVQVQQALAATSPHSLPLLPHCNHVINTVPVCRCVEIRFGRRTFLVAAAGMIAAGTVVCVLALSPFGFSPVMQVCREAATAGRASEQLLLEWPQLALRPVV